MTLDHLSAIAEQRCAPFPFEFSIVRSARRRSISIEVNAAKVIIRAPIKGVDEAILQQFLREKTEWVLEKVQSQRELLVTIPSYSYTAGCRLPYLGGELTLVLGIGSQGRVVKYDENLHVIIPHRRRLSAQEQTRRLVMSWYQREALRILTKKTDQLVAQMGLVYTGVNIRATKTKWGHCTSSGAIQYNGQIILAPEAIVDYLVAHEVSHLRHHNHGPAFWQLVASVCPEYQQSRAWLKMHGQQLVL